MVRETRPGVQISVLLSDKQEREAESLQCNIQGVLFLRCSCNVGRGSRLSANIARLRVWIRRELEAVLQTEDTSLLCSLVVDLAAKTGIDAGGQSHGASHEAAMMNLRPYLGAYAVHFWHELRHLPPPFRPLLETVPFVFAAW